MATEIKLDQEYLPFGLAVAMERDRVGSPNTKFGFNATCGNTAETIWTQSNAYTWNAAAQLELTSTDADDTDTTGNGARSVTIEGLDANYAEISETVDMNGQTADAGSTTTASFLRVNRMYVATAGSTGVNEGIIYASTVLRTISPRFGRASMPTPGRPCSAFTRCLRARRCTCSRFGHPAPTLLIRVRLTF
jgi:hypothetical protein